MDSRQQVEKPAEKPAEKTASSDLAATTITARENHDLICAIRMKAGDSTLVPVLHLEIGKSEAKPTNLMPKDSSLSSSKPGQIKAELGQVLEKIPNLALDPAIKDLLCKMKNISIDGGHVRMEGRATSAVMLRQLGKEINVTLSNPSVDLVPDDKNPNSFHLKNIKGIKVAGFSPSDISMTLEKNQDGGSQLRIKGSAGIAFDQTIPLDKATTEFVERSFAQMRDWIKSPETTTAVDLAAGILGTDLKQTLGGALDGIKGFKAKNDEVEINREKASTNDLGGLKLDLAVTIKATLSTEGKETVVKNIEGVTAKLPIPDEIAKAAGINGSVPIKEVRIGEADKDGNRVIRIKTDAAFDEVRVKVDKNMKPCTDAKGNITVDFQLKNGRDSLGLTMTFNPSKVESNGKVPDFKVDILAGTGDRSKLIEGLFGKNLVSPIKEIVSEAVSITKEGDTVRIKMDKDSSHDLNGSKIDVSKDISFKLIQDGKGGVKLDNVTGLKLKVNAAVPAFIMRVLGLPFPKDLPVGIKSFELSAPDSERNRSIAIETDSLVNKISMFVGPDMKPVLNQNGDYNLGVIMTNPTDPQNTLNFGLRFDKSNQINMSNAQLLGLGLRLTNSAAFGLWKNLVVPLDPLVPLAPLLPLVPVAPLVAAPGLIKRAIPVAKEILNDILDLIP